jgi:hypothetical protein
MKILPLILLFIGIAILVFAFLASTDMYKEVLDMNGFNEMNKVSVTVKNKTPNLMFTLSDMDKLKEQLGTEQLAYYALTNATIEDNNQYYSTKISGVNPYYRSFIDFNMIRGSFFTYKGNQCKYVVVIDANLAWDMFNSVDIIGKEIELYGKKFEIVGVYEKYNLLDDRSNENIIERFTNDGLSNIYMPVNTLMENNPDILIDTVFIKIGSENIVGENENRIGDALQSIGKWIPNYKIVDFNKNKVLLEQKPKMILFILALIIVLIIVAFIKIEIVKLYGIIKRNRSNNYMIRLVASHWRQLIMQAVKVIISLLLAVFILLNVKFNLYISPEYLNDELIDTKYYTDLLDSKIHEFNQDLNIAKSQSLLEYNMADKLTNFLFFVAILIGIPLIHTSIHLLLRDDIRIIRIVCCLAGFFGTSLLLTLLTLSRLGLPYTFDFKSAGIIWMYALASILYSYYRKETVRLAAELVLVKL